MKMPRMVLLVFLPIFCICMDKSPFYLKAQEVDINGEMIKYKNIFSTKKDYADISFYLESYMMYWHRALLLLNKGLVEDLKLYKLIEKYGVFHKQKVVLPINNDKLINEFNYYLNENGLKIGYGEGNVFLYFDPIYVSSNFRGILPDIIIEFFIIESSDVNEGFEEDATLTVSWDCIRKKIIKYDEYFDKIKNINCPYIKKETKDKILLYLNVYFKGIDNSRIDDCIDEARSSYEIFLAENKNSIYYKMIENYYYDLKRNNFKFSYKDSTVYGRTYETTMIFDNKNKEISVSDVADKYLNEIKAILAALK